MLHFLWNRVGELKQILTDYDQIDRPTAKLLGYYVTNRNDFDSFEHAQRVARAAFELTRVEYLPVERRNGLPKFDVIEAPKIGDLISYSFNGDTYPCGTIVKISASFRRIESSDRRTFYRRDKTASWISGGTWTMVQGHHNERNPSF